MSWHRESMCGDLRPDKSTHTRSQQCINRSGRNTPSLTSRVVDTMSSDNKTSKEVGWGEETTTCSSSTVLSKPKWSRYWGLLQYRWRNAFPFFRTFIVHEGDTDGFRSTVPRCICDPVHFEKEHKGWQSEHGHTLNHLADDWVLNSNSPAVTPLTGNQCWNRLHDQALPERENRKLATDSDAARETKYEWDEYKPRSSAIKKTKLASWIGSEYCICGCFVRPLNSRGENEHRFEYSDEQSAEQQMLLRANTFIASHASMVADQNTVSDYHFMRRVDQPNGLVSSRSAAPFLSIQSYR